MFGMNRLLTRTTLPIMHIVKAPGMKLHFLPLPSSLWVLFDDAIHCLNFSCFFITIKIIYFYRVSLRQEVKNSHSVWQNSIDSCEMALKSSPSSFVNISSNSSRIASFLSSLPSINPLALYMQSIQHFIASCLSLPSLSSMPSKCSLQAGSSITDSSFGNGQHSSCNFFVCFMHFIIFLWCLCLPFPEWPPPPFGPPSPSGPSNPPKPCAKIL